MALKNRRILIIAGPTWVPLDDVRIITNIATGETGVLLAEEAKKTDAVVTLIKGPISFADLRKKIRRELAKKNYDFIIHNAAVADFAPQPVKGKISSAKPYNLKLRPLPKISRDIRRLAPEAKLVIFKLETRVADRILLKRARKAMHQVEADLVVANRINPYRAFIVDREGGTVFIKSKIELARKLLKLLIK